MKRHEKQSFGNNVEIVDSFRKEKWLEKIVKKLCWENLKYIVSLNRCGLNKQVIFYGSFAAIFFTVFSFASLFFLGMLQIYLLIIW